MDKTEKRSGYTLLEMTIVLVIAALVFGIGALGFSALKARATPRRLAEEIVDLVDAARIGARRDQATRSVIIDLEAKTAFATDGRLRIRIPSDYSVSVVAGREVSADANVPEIRFLPDGTSSGGEIVVSDPSGAQARIDISWLSGLARISDARP
jgi:general secretion pathway protein H